MPFVGGAAATVCEAPPPRLLGEPIPSESRAALRTGAEEHHTGHKFTDPLTWARPKRCDPHELGHFSMAIRYIGSKCRIAKEILDLAGEPVRGGCFVDPFAGMGSVSREAASRGWRVRASDLLQSAGIMTRAQLTTAAEVPFATLGGYGAVVATLNALPPISGYFTREYSPSDGKANRQYFTVENARRIDAMRKQIASWTSAERLTEIEQQLLLADLMEAVNGVASTAGTYGCFLRKFDRRALRPIEIRCRALMQRRQSVDVSIRDASNVRISSGDILYLDPPYTKRQYAAYYHILETIAAGDRPAVSGITGLRPWRDRSSVFCHKSLALDSICALITQSGASRVLLSYSDEGHVSLNDLTSRLRNVGHITTHEVGTLQRYAPNAASATRAGAVREVVIELRRARATRAHQPRPQLDLAF